MSETSDKIRELEAALVVAKAQRDKEVKANRQAVVTRLSELRRDIDAMVLEGKKLAAEADLVFYYSSGYEEFTWIDSENWTSSTADC